MLQMCFKCFQISSAYLEHGLQAFEHRRLHSSILVSQLTAQMVQASCSDQIVDLLLGASAGCIPDGPRDLVPCCGKLQFHHLQDQRNEARIDDCLNVQPVRPESHFGTILLCLL